ncbi:mCG145096, partial [Mus musculus]
GREEAGGAGVLVVSPGPGAALMGLSPWPIRVPRIGVVLSGIRIPKQPARPSWRAGRRPWEPPACQMLSYDCSGGPLSCLLSSTSPLPKPLSFLQALKIPHYHLL